jgi:hypothetical protein
MTRSFAAVAAIVLSLPFLIGTESTANAGCRGRHHRGRSCCACDTCESCTPSCAASTQLYANMVDITGFYWMWCNNNVWQMCDGSQPQGTQCYLRPYGYLGKACDKDNPPVPPKPAK